MTFTREDRVKVVDPSRGPTTGKRYAGKIGSVLRTTSGGYVEVELDSLEGVGTGLVAFRSDELQASTKVRMTKRHRFTDGRATLPVEHEPCILEG